MYSQSSSSATFATGGSSVGRPAIWTSSLMTSSVVTLLSMAKKASSSAWQQHTKTFVSRIQAAMCLTVSDSAGVLSFYETKGSPCNSKRGHTLKTYCLHFHITVYLCPSCAAHICSWRPLLYHPCLIGWGHIMACNGSHLLQFAVFVSLLLLDDVRKVLWTVKGHLFSYMGRAGHINSHERCVYI